MPYMSTLSASHANSFSSSSFMSMCKCANTFQCWISIFDHVNITMRKHKQQPWRNNTTKYKVPHLLKNVCKWKSRGKCCRQGAKRCTIKSSMRKLQSKCNACHVNLVRKHIWSERQIKRNDVLGLCT
jgi:hypothetical protein